jgi:hydroxymethylglutaryl-CoA reductase (NADPH)
LLFDGGGLARQLIESAAKDSAGEFAMATTGSFETTNLSLIPRFTKQGYDPASVALRREWLESKTGSDLNQIGSFSISSNEMKGNIENPVGAVQIPLGIAGPLLVNGLYARGQFYVPLATTEGALVRSYERGMALLTRAGGVDARVHADENCVAPAFFFRDVIESYEFASRLTIHFGEIRREAEATTKYGKLLRLEPQVEGRNVIVKFHYYTGDAHGMNMIVKATDHACRWIMETLHPTGYHIFSGLESEKRASGGLFTTGKGKTVTAGALVPADFLELYLRATPAQFVTLWHHTVLGHMQAHVVGYNGHFANGLAAMFIAYGQDVGNLPNCAVGLTNFEVTANGDLYASVTLPSLTVATVGGGTAAGTARECLAVLGCEGAMRAPKLAEIVASTLLAGELSFGATIINGELVGAHDRYGRNRPVPDQGN